MQILPSLSRGSQTSFESPESGGVAFAAEMTRLLREVNADQVEAAGKIQDLVVHGRGTIHDAMIAMSNAEGSFRLLMEMRNRIVDGVNQLLSTQL